MSFCEYEERSTELYRQCRLEKYVDGIIYKQVSWIPAKYAKHGKVLKLRHEDGSWDNGWIVAEIGEELQEHQVDRLRRARFIETGRRVNHDGKARRHR